MADSEVIKLHDLLMYKETVHISNLLPALSWCLELNACRDVELTEKLDYSSAVAFIGFSLIVAILRALNVRDEAAKVMVSAPIISFVTTHILYLNFYKLDYGNSSIL